MNYNQVKILFVLNRAKANMKGLSPLICRMTFNNKRKEFSTGFYVSEGEWNAKLQVATSKSILINYELKVHKKTKNKYYFKN